MRFEFTGRTCRLPLLQLLITAGLALLLAACGSSSTLHPGYPVLTMTATNSGGQFSSYNVTVASITLTEQNGTVVSFSPTVQQIDLVRLADISELVSAYSVPYGTYKSAALLLDYSAASVSVIVDGKPVAASIAGPGNTALGQVNVVVTFDPANPLVVTLQKATPVRMNFDLQAFNSISTAKAIPAVTVQPYVTMNPTQVDATPLRARGSFVTVQNGFIVMNLRPFYNFSSSLGAVLVYPTADAYFSVNGVVYTGPAGLAAMASVQQSTVIAAYGTLTGVAGPDSNTATNPTFSAKEIYVGTSQENGFSYVAGMVASRAGNKLTLTGTTLNVFSGISYFVPVTFVTLAATVPVSQDGVNVPGLSTQSISVGQYVYISGSATDANGAITYDSAGNLLFDATAGSVRLLHTRLWGTLVSSAPSSATFDLLSLGHYPPIAYNFAGTGSSAPADPAAYQVNTGMSDLSGTAAGTLMAIDGATTAFGAAPPDFNATALTPASALEQTLVVQWPSGEAAPFSSASAGGYVLDLSKTTIGSIHDIYSGPAAIDLKSLPASPLITTTGAGQTTLQLSIGSTSLTPGISMFATPAAYYTSVHATLNGTQKLYTLVAAGHFNSASNTFVADRISMSLTLK
jgi:hypothetical protein